MALVHVTNELSGLLAPEGTALPLLFKTELPLHAGVATLQHRWLQPLLSVSGRESPRCTPARMEHQPAEGAVGLLRLLTGMRDGSRGARSGGGMLLVMMALAGLLTKKPVKRADSKRR